MAAPAAITRNAHNVQDNGATNSNTAVAALTGVKTGDLITCEITFGDTSSTDASVTFSSVSDPSNGTYSPAITLHHNTTMTQWIGLYYIQNAAAGNYSVTLTVAASSGRDSYLAISCQSWTGAATSSALDSAFAQQQDKTSTANPTTGSALTPSAAGELVLGNLITSAHVPTAGTYYTLTDSASTTYLWPEYWIQTTATATNALFTLSSDRWTDQMVAFKPASSGSAGAAPAITSAASASGTVGSAFSYQITATNAPASYGAAGLPAGLTVNSGTGLISGTPTAAGTSTVTVSATNSSGTGSATLTLTIAVAAPAITSATSASGTVGSAFSYQITATNAPASYGAAGLPAGLTVNSGTGLISGTPTAAGTSTVTLSATNSSGTGSASLTLTIASGTGTTPAPVVSLSPTSLTFGSQTVGTTGAAQTITLNNTGNAALNITNITFTGTNASDFSQTDNCGSSVLAGGNCTIGVTFTPTLTTIETAGVTITDDATDSPQTVTLTAGGQFMVLDPTKAHLVNTFTGKPVFLAGDTAWSLIAQLDDSDVVTYLADRASRGMNAIIVNLIEHQYATNDSCSSGRADYNGDCPFTGASFSTPNSTYFAHADYVIQQAANYGITVFLFNSFAGWNCNSLGEGWATDMESASDATMVGWGKYVGNRYANYPNVVHVIGDDTDPSSCSPSIIGKLNAIATGLMETDPNHLITAVNGEGETTIDVYTPPLSYPWLSIGVIYQKTLSSIVSSAVYAYEQSNALPFFQVEDEYELDGVGTQPTELQVRTEGYQAVLSGATLGRVFGNGIVWCFGEANAASAVPCATSPTWQNQLSSVGSVGQSWLGALFRSREFWKMVPDLSNSVMTAGYGSGLTDARSSDGQTIIAYIPNGNATTVAVDMSQITSASSTAICWWFNPSDGSTTRIGTYTNSGSQYFTPPDSNDWVLVIDDASANLAAPGIANL